MQVVEMEMWKDGERLDEAWPKGAATMAALESGERRATTLLGISQSEQTSTETSPSLADLARKWGGRMRSGSAVEESRSGLEELVSRGDLLAALSLSERLLTAAGQGRGSAGTAAAAAPTPYSLGLWARRFHLLLLLGQTTTASEEMASFGELESPDLFYDFNPTGLGKPSGCMVPFSLRLSHAQIPSLTGDPGTSLSRLSRLLSALSGLRSWASGEDGSAGLVSAVDARSAEVWRGMARVAAAQKDFRLAEEAVTKLSPQTQPEAASLLARLRLQLGDYSGGLKVSPHSSQYR